jgi:hypothetical protein
VRVGLSYDLKETAPREQPSSKGALEEYDSASVSAYEENPLSDSEVIETEAI